MMMPVEYRSYPYDRTQCAIFINTGGMHSGLSNWADHFPMVVNGHEIRCSEGLYQACKFPYLPETQRKIISSHAYIAKQEAVKWCKYAPRPDWFHINVRIMRWVLRVKFACNPTKMEKLLEDTGNMPIVEWSVTDDFWGAKPAHGKSETLVGRNALGRLLMELREHRRHLGTEQMRYVPVPPVADFLLLGETITDVDFRNAA